MAHQSKFSKRISTVVPLLTIAIAYVSSILGIFLNIFFTKTEGIILFVLGLLATDNLVERINILKRIETAILENPSAGKFTAKNLYEPKINPFEMPEFDQAKEISISGVTLINLVSGSSGKLVHLLDSGCKVRLMMMAPSAPAIAHPNPESIPDVIGSAKGMLELLMKQHRNLEIKSYDYNPPFGLVIVDSKKPNGFLVVTTYPYKTDDQERPRIILRHEDNDPWYDFYVRQFTAMWKDAHPLTS